MTTIGAHDRVVAALAAWDGDADSRGALIAALREHLDASVDSPVVRCRGEGPPDLAVDRVGVLVFTDFGRADVTELSLYAERLREEHDALVCYGHDIDPGDLDRWRMGRFKSQLLGFDVDDVSFVRGGTGAASDAGSSRWPTRLWRFAEAFVAFLAVVIGLELAVAVELAFPSAVDAVGPGATLGTVVVLATALVALRERLEL